MDLTREEIVRVPTFQETLRADESVLFQQILRLTPGTYKVTVTVGTRARLPRVVPRANLSPLHSAPAPRLRRSSPTRLPGGAH